MSKIDTFGISWRKRIHFTIRSLRLKLGLRPFRFVDRRNGLVVFVPHCALNQNSRVDGTAERRAAVHELIQGLLDRGIGIVQLPCPELLLIGLDRADSPIREILLEAQPQSRLCDMACEVANQIQQYRSCGIKVLGILGKNGSPTCGVEQTYENGQIRSGKGLFIEKLHQILEIRNMPTNIIGYIDSAPMESLKTIDYWLNQQL